MEEEQEVRMDIGGFEPGPPDFSEMMQPFKVLSWLPFILTAVLVFIFVSLFQIIFNVLTQPDAPITYGAIAAMSIISLISALIVGLLAKFNAERKTRSKMKSIRID